MTGKELLEEIDRRDYYDQKEREHLELVDCWWFAVKLSVIIFSLLSIAGHVRELWMALASCF